MRRIVGVHLVLLYLLGPLIAFAPAGAESRLPACCRRSGSHHCMMSMGERAALENGDAHLAWSSSKCPYWPVQPKAAHTPASLYQSISVSSISLDSHPNGVVQSESKRRISGERSRSNRGPPESQLL
jgi:hypothetical protein